MWLLVARPPLPDAPHWRGRRWFALVDALAWPIVALLVFRQVLEPGGLVWPVAVALATIVALSRIHRAVWFNHRYRFTTSRWGSFVGVVLVLGAALMLTLLR